MLPSFGLSQVASISLRRVLMCTAPMKPRYKYLRSNASSQKGHGGEMVVVFGERQSSNAGHLKMKTSKATMATLKFNPGMGGAYHS